MSRSWQGGSTRRWRTIRAAVLDRDRHRCQLRLDGCTTVATEAHHTRRRELVGDDPTYLVAACSACNKLAGEPGRGDPEPDIRPWWQ